MTRKDYELIARVLHDVIEDAAINERDTLREVVRRFADALQTERVASALAGRGQIAPAFKRELFMKACGF